MNESDWKQYCVLRPIAHERMCERILSDVEKTLLDKSIAPYERIDRSEELLKAGQKELYWAFGVFRFSRHEARSHLVGLCGGEDRPFTRWVEGVEIKGVRAPRNRGRH